MQRLSVWLLVLCLAFATACGPPDRDDNDGSQKEDGKNERKEGKHRVPLLILSGLKLIYKIIKSK